MAVRELRRPDVRRLSTCVITILAVSASAWSAPATELTVDQIIARYIEARGGAQAWHDVHAMAWTGHIESGQAGTNVPYLLMFRRPNATRFEIMAQNQKLVRVFDGNMGWKLRPTEQGKPEWQDYSAEEVRSAQDAAGLDGPLIDYHEKGVSVVLRGQGLVEGHPAYRLEVALPSGQTRTDWIDAKSFLELKYDRNIRDAAGRSGVVSVYYRNYQKIQGLKLPLTIETGNPGSKDSEKMYIEKIALNPEVTENVFSKPTIAPKRRGGVVIDARKPPVPPKTP